MNNDDEDDSDDLCEYELKRKRTIHQNLQMMSSIGLTTNTILDVDAIVVDKAYFPPFLASSLTPKIIVDAMNHEGFQIPKNSKKSLNGCLITFGHELIRSKKASLKKHFNLSREDIVF